MSEATREPGLVQEARKTAAEIDASTDWDSIDGLSVSRLLERVDRLRAALEAKTAEADNLRRERDTFAARCDRLDALMEG